MAVYAGPEIVNDGLVLSLDAANAKSYPGSGTTWTDLSGNDNNATLVNGVGHDGINMIFDGGDDYIQTAYGSGINVLTNPITVCSFVKSDVTDVQIMWLDVGTNGSNQRFYASITTASRSDFGIQSSSWSNGRPEDTNWHYQVLVMDSGVARFYNNGIQVQTKNYTSYTLPGNIQFGSRNGTAYFWNGKISQISIYNKALSAEEIQQNFNAHRGRFGI